MTRHGFKIVKRGPQLSNLPLEKGGEKTERGGGHIRDRVRRGKRTMVKQEKR